MFDEHVIHRQRLTDQPPVQLLLVTFLAAAVEQVTVGPHQDEPIAWKFSQMFGHQPMGKCAFAVHQRRDAAFVRGHAVLNFGHFCHMPFLRPANPRV